MKTKTKKKVVKARGAKTIKRKQSLKERFTMLVRVEKHLASYDVQVYSNENLMHDLDDIANQYYGDDVGSGGGFGFYDRQYRFDAFKWAYSFYKEAEKLVGKKGYVVFTTYVS